LTPVECKQFFGTTPAGESPSFTRPVWRGRFWRCPEDLVSDGSVIYIFKAKVPIVKVNFVQLIV
jgi:hypothetical protein